MVTTNRFGRTSGPPTGDMEKMPREERAMSEVQTLDYRIEISESGGKGEGRHKHRRDASRAGLARDELPLRRNLRRSGRG